jgi:hypothetical protein
MLVASFLLLLILFFVVPGHTMGSNMATLSSNMEDSAAA